MSTVVPPNLADRIAELLRLVYETKSGTFGHEANCRGITVHQLAAAAIAELVRESICPAAGH